MPAVTLSVFSNSAQPVVLTVCGLGVGFMVWFLAGLLLDAGRLRKRDRRFLIITSRVFGRIRPGFQGVHSNTLKAGDGNLEFLTVRFSSPQKYERSLKSVALDRGQVPGPSTKARSR